MGYSYNRKKSAVNHLLQKNKLALPQMVVNNLGNLGDRLLVYKTKKGNLNGLHPIKSRRT